LAVIGIEQLKKLERFNQKRRQIAKSYLKSLKNLDCVRTPSIIKGIKHSWQIFPIIINPKEAKISRDQLIEKLAKLNVGTSVHFKPVHLFSLYRKTLGYKKGELPVSESIYENILSLPMFPGMTLKDAKYVVKALEKIVNKD